MPFPIDIWSMFAILLVLGILFWLYRTIRNQYDEQRYQEELAAMEFEQSVVGATALISEDDNRFTIRANTEPAPSAAPVPLEDAPPLTAPPPPGEATADPLTPVIDRLKAAGLFQNIETYLDHNGVSRYAALVKITGNKLVLVVPDMESAAFLRHQLKRCDSIILTPPGGDSFVVRPMGAWLADALGSRLL